MAQKDTDVQHGFILALVENISSNTISLFCKKKNGFVEVLVNE